jgi:hypothetical protein
MLVMLNTINFALKFLSIPFSNAVVERVFSVMNLVKSKIRNKMNIDMLYSILRTRIHFSNEKVCCQSFIPTNKMLELFTYDIYNNKANVRKSQSETEDQNMFDEIIETVS